MNLQLSALSRIAHDFEALSDFILQHVNKNMQWMRNMSTKKDFCSIILKESLDSCLENVVCCNMFWIVVCFIKDMQWRLSSNLHKGMIEKALLLRDGLAYLITDSLVELYFELFNLCLLKISFDVEKESLSKGLGTTVEKTRVLWYSAVPEIKYYTPQSSSATRYISSFSHIFSSQKTMKFWYWVFIHGDTMYLPLLCFRCLQRCTNIQDPN